MELKNDVLVYYGLSEETGMQDIEYFCRTQQVPDFNLVADTNFPVCYGEKGLMRADIERGFEGNLVSFHAGSVVNVIPAKAEAVINSVDLKDARQQLDGVRGISVDQDGEYVKVTALGISRHAGISGRLRQCGPCAGQSPDRKRPPYRQRGRGGKGRG